MPDFFTPPRVIVAVKFGFSDKTYDYFADFPVELSQKVFVETKRGEAKVQIVEVKTDSEAAEKAILRYVSEDIRSDDERAAKHENGFPVFARDGTMLDQHGNRSIFDDVDK